MLISDPQHVKGHWPAILTELLLTQPRRAQQLGGPRPMDLARGGNSPPSELSYGESASVSMTSPGVGGDRES